MSKELEVLKEIREYLYGDVYSGLQERLDIIEAELMQKEKQDKVLKIIKEKRVNTHMLVLSDSLEKYNFFLLPYRKLTQEEYDLLKGVLS